MAATKSKFLLLVRFSTAAPAKASSPEEMQAAYGAWKAWMSKFEKELQPGDGLKPSGAVVRGGNVTDGPYIEMKEMIASYAMVETDSLARAIEIAKEMPISADPSASVEVRELGGYKI